MSYRGPTANMSGYAQQAQQAQMQPQYTQFQQQQQQPQFDQRFTQRQPAYGMNMNMNMNRGSTAAAAAGMGSSDSSSSGTFKKLLEKLNDEVENLGSNPTVRRLQPYIPGLARFFIVATFYEDSFRILTQWSDQMFYLHSWKGYNYYFVVVFLLTVVITMLTGATCIMLRRQVLYATGALCSVIVLQGIVYGFLTGVSFLLRNFSVIGGLLIAFGDSIVQDKNTFGLLPELHDKNETLRGYVLLAGRILTILLFIGFAFTKSWFTVCLTVLGTVCFAIGYKTKLASLMLGLILTFYNVTVNNYWFHSDTKRDFLRYEFYQNLSIIGGLLLVTNTGAGDFSVDSKKKKIY